MSLQTIIQAFCVVLLKVMFTPTIWLPLVETLFAIVGLVLEIVILVFLQFCMMKKQALVAVYCNLVLIVCFKLFMLITRQSYYKKFPKLQFGMFVWELVWGLVEFVCVKEDQEFPGDKYIFPISDFLCCLLHMTEIFYEESELQIEMDRLKSRIQALEKQMGIIKLEKKMVRTFVIFTLYVII